MDEFEKEYFKKITPIASDFQDRRQELAKSRIKMFVATLCRLVFENHEKFDLILGAGNSGLYMTKIAEMTFEKLNIPVPQVLNIPLFRFSDEQKNLHDNSSLTSLVKEGLKDLKAENVLFTDTEIMQGISAKEAVSLVLDINPAMPIQLTIVAENHFFEWHHKLPEVSLRFFSYSPLIQGLNDNISYFVPKDFYEEIEAVIGENFAYNFAMAILVGGAIKRKNGQGVGFFDESIISDLEGKIPGFDIKRKDLIKELGEVISEGIAEYKDGKVDFRFV